MPQDKDITGYVVEAHFTFTAVNKYGDKLTDDGGAGSLDYRTTVKVNGLTGVGAMLAEVSQVLAGKLPV